MGETHWEDLRTREVTYDDHRWSLTGDLEILESGESLAVQARQEDDVRHRDGTLYFAVEDTDDSLNPGNLGDHFDRLDTSGPTPIIVVKTEGRSYRYELVRMEYE